jgi:hypothetical protein
MRAIKAAGDYRVKAIAGTRAVLMALDCAESCRHKLMGFAFRREVVGGPHPSGKWLRSGKVFRSVVPDPKNARDPNDPTKPMRFSTWEHPIQSFLWGDYTAEPDTLYRITVVPMYGRPGALQPQPGLVFEVRTEPERAQGHGVWFNRGAIASQAFEREFGNKAPSQEEINDPKAAETAWLSRGLLDACLGFIEETPAGDGLRVAAYEFTYQPVLAALKAALDRGVDVRIVYQDTAAGTGSSGANEQAIGAAGLPRKVGIRQVLFPRTRTKIPHNKFIVRLEGGARPSAVWSGSTNFTPSGFLGQSNVGHLVEDAATAKRFLSYWQLLRQDPEREAARAGAMTLTPDPPALIHAGSIVPLFSPRPTSDLLKWYGKRIEDAAAGVMFTAAFGVTKALVGPLARERDFLRFILMEKPPTETVRLELTKDRDCVIAWGATLGEMYAFKDGKPVARKPIEEFELDKWLLEEEHYRHEGFVFFVHTKFLIIDPLSDDPLVCTGSANFSPNSLLQNDENMLLIRGDTRVADIYLTEFDRLFRHFYFRDVANEVEARGGEAEGVFLKETSEWTESYFRPGAFKTRRREMLFADPATTWVANAAKATPAAAPKPAAGAKKTKKTTSAAAKATPKATKTAKPKTQPASRAAKGTAKRKPASRKSGARKTGAGKRAAANKRARR